MSPKRPTNSYAYGVTSRSILQREVVESIAQRRLSVSVGAPRRLGWNDIRPSDNRGCGTALAGSAPGRGFVPSTGVLPHRRMAEASPGAPHVCASCVPNSRHRRYRRCRENRLGVRTKQFGVAVRTRKITHPPLSARPESITGQLEKPFIALHERPSAGTRRASVPRGWLLRPAAVDRGP